MIQVTRTIIIDEADTIALADRYGMTLVAREGGEQERD